MFIVIYSWFLGGFGAVLFFFFFLLPLLIEKKNRNASKTTQILRRDDNEQLKYNLTVLFSSIFALTSEDGLPVLSIYRVGEHEPKLNPGQIDASQRKFAKPELTYRLAKGGQTDSQVGSQVPKTVNFTTCVDLRWVAKR